MAGPIVFISHSGVKEGRLEDLRSLTAEVMERLEDSKPETVAMLAYLDADDAVLSIVHVFGDAEAMDRHFEGATERARTAYELMEPRGWEIYGSPSEAVLGSMRAAAEAAQVELRVVSRFSGGFLRAPARNAA
ncbi:MAG: hypothetical protein K5924_03985 [Chloroflexi bacterium]|nr:hypothetical protein [Chloroflexota bacterium]